MNDIPEEEARQIIATQRYCHDAPDWNHVGTVHGLSEICCGVLDDDGIRTSFEVLLLFKHSQKTKAVSYKFSLMKKNPWGTERVYQLDLYIPPVKPKDKHQWPHEHIGNLRIIADEGWRNFTFEDALRRFCETARIVFIPPLNHPHQFSLKG